jgi:hypothetical protein
MINNLILIFTFLIFLGFTCDKNIKDNNQSSNLDSISMKVNDSIKVYVILPRENYKKYEPLYVKIKIINRKKTDIDIYSIFNLYSGGVNFYFISENDETLHYRNIPIESLYKNYPIFRLSSYDTLVTSVPVNDFIYPSNINEMFFDLSGHFIPGQYKMFALVNNGREVYSSDTVGFNVLDLGEEDKIILEKYKIISFDEIKSLFPSSVFDEHILAYKCASTGDIDETISHYTEFFSIYPNSIYNLNYFFVFHYFYKINIKYKIEDLDELIRKLELKNKTEIYGVLHNEKILENIYNGLNEYNKLNR